MKHFHQTAEALAANPNWMREITDPAERLALATAYHQAAPEPGAPRLSRKIAALRVIGREDLARHMEDDLVRAGHGSDSLRRSVADARSHEAAHQLADWRERCEANDRAKKTAWAEKQKIEEDLGEPLPIIRESESPSLSGIWLVACIPLARYRDWLEGDTEAAVYAVQAEGGAGFDAMPVSADDVLRAEDWNDCTDNASDEIAMHCFGATVADADGSLANWIERQNREQQKQFRRECAIEYARQNPRDDDADETSFDDDER